MLLYLASNNPGKLLEFREAARERDILVEPVPGIDELPACIEDGTSFEENARKKAIHYSACRQGLVFADDSGLCVDALDGAPGIHSARFASSDLTQSKSPHTGLQNINPDPANNTKLLQKLEGVTDDIRTAHYVCVIALAQNGRVLGVAEGRVDGRITKFPCGDGGFGYDPYFFYPPLGKTFAELTAGEKFAVSHRGHAFRRLLALLNIIVHRSRNEESDRCL